MGAGTRGTGRDLMSLLYKQHPWHGVPIGEHAPERVTAYIEIVPTDTVKYELDKASGFLKVDRPQRFSNVCPSLYGFIPQTLCGVENGALCGKRLGRSGIVGDGDPLDICVLTEKDLSHGDFLLQAIPIGGLRMLDGDQADDKIIAVLQDDAVYGGWRDTGDCPKALIDRLRHYFLTYKQPPGDRRPRTEVPTVYDREEAYEVIRVSRVDYESRFPGLSALLGTPPAG